MQRELHHWIPLLNYFDSYVEKYAALRHASPSLFDPPEWAEDAFPKRNILAILRTTALILKMCVQKQPYNSLEVRAHDFFAHTTMKYPWQTMTLEVTQTNALGPPVAVPRASYARFARLMVPVAILKHKHGLHTWWDFYFVPSAGHDSTFR
jgi:hypothetical protein